MVIDTRLILGSHGSVRSGDLPHAYTSHGFNVAFHHYPAGGLVRGCLPRQRTRILPTCWFLPRHTIVPLPAGRPNVLPFYTPSTSLAVTLPYFTNVDRGRTVLAFTAYLAYTHLPALAHSAAPHGCYTTWWLLDTRGFFPATPYLPHVAATRGDIRAVPRVDSASAIILVSRLFCLGWIWFCWTSRLPVSSSIMILLFYGRSPYVLPQQYIALPHPLQYHSPISCVTHFSFT